MNHPPNPLKQEKPAFRLTYDDPGCCACQEYYHLRMAWLEDDRPVGQRTAYLEVWQHVRSCPTCQARAQLAVAFVEAQKAIPVEAGNFRPLPVVLEAVDA